MSYSDEKFTIECNNGVFKDWMDDCGYYVIPWDMTDEHNQSFRHSLSARLTDIDNIFVNPFNRIILCFSINRISAERLYFGYAYNMCDKYNTIYNDIRAIDGRHQMIGLFMFGSNSLYILFRDDNAITYCLISDVSDQWIHN